MTESNRDVIARAFRAWQDGTAPITDVLADELVWRIEGRSAVAGEYVDLRHFVDGVLAPFGQRFAHGERFRPVRVRSILDDGDAVVVVWDGRGVANDGVPYENSYAWIMLSRREGRASTWREALPPLVGGVLVAFYELLALGALRLWAETTLGVRWVV